MRMKMVSRRDLELLWKLRDEASGKSPQKKKRLRDAPLLVQAKKQQAKKQQAKKQSPIQVQVGEPQVKPQANPQAQVKQQAKKQSYEAQAKENREKVLDLASELAKFAGVLVPGAAASGLGVGGTVAGAVTGNAIGDDVAELLKSILDAIQEVVRLLGLYAPALQEIIKDLGPAMRQMNDLVVEPYLGLVRDAKTTMEKLKEEAVAGRLDPDALTPPITSPYQDWKRVSSIATASSIPIYGDIFRNEMNILTMARYQTASGRGWPSDYEMMQWASHQHGLLSPAMDIADMIPAGKIPQWFLKN